MAMTSQQVDKLAGRLWPDDGCSIFALLDGAGIPGLIDRMQQAPGLEFECLFSGELEAGVDEVAPYIARLEAGSEFARWVMGGWGQRRGGFVQVPRNVELPVLRRHFRKLNLVYGPDGNSMLFRYYDPRVLWMFLSACERQQVNAMFGPVSSYIFEGNSENEGVTISVLDGGLIHQQFELA
jgi:hypothetical protein